MRVACPTSTEPLAPRFTGMPLDRVSAQRSDPAWVERQAGAPGARAVAASHDSVLVDPAGEALLRLPMPRAAEAVPASRAGETARASHAGETARASRAGEEPILLGLEEGAPLFAIELSALDPERWRARGVSAVTLRDAGGMLPQSEGGLAAYAVALLGWHRRHRYCANCGSATDLADGGYSRHCPNCGTSHFPRTDPVVIMLVEHEGRLLLGRRAGWPGRRFSVLAGFVSPGESVEEAVVREVREESGLVAYDPQFVASQPWPFPASLMLGFTARSDGGRPVARDGELEEVAWFTREQVSTAAREDGADMALPPPVSIARFLIDRWLAGE